MGEIKNMMFAICYFALSALSIYIAQFHYHLVSLRYLIKAAPILMMAHGVSRVTRGKHSLVFFGLLFSAIGDLCLITSKLDDNSIQQLTRNETIILASGIISFGI